MRHRKTGRILGRSSSHRKAMFRNMVTSFLEEEKIQTTTPKAKELRRLAEKLITLGKNNAPSLVAAAGSEEERQRLTAKRVAAVRQAGKVVRNRDTLQKLFGDLAERYQERPGGYTRILKLGRRQGDNAEMSIIELIPEGEDFGVDLENVQVASPAAQQAVAQKPVEEPEVEEAETEEPEADEEDEQS